jgi:hypothetical protein
MYDFVISINVHENPAFLNEQIKNIKNNINYKYIILLNCNKFMYDNYRLPDNVIKNPEIIEKKRFHGSITKGICSNMIYALNNFQFKYFIILSSKNIFYKLLNMKMIQNDFIKSPDTDTDKWFWPSLKNTLLAKYYINNNKNLYSSEHEGLTFDHKSCENIIYFLKNNSNIEDELFNYNNAVEEFSLQTICMNSNNNPFILLGNGPGDFFINHNEMNKCLYKIPRDSKYIHINNSKSNQNKPLNKNIMTQIINYSKIK